MHTHPRCSKYTLNQEWSYKNRRSGCPEFGQSFIPHNYDAQKSAGSGSLDFWTKHYSKYNEDIMIQSKWPEHDHTCRNAHFPPSCNNNKQHQHGRQHFLLQNIVNVYTQYYELLSHRPRGRWSIIYSLSLHIIYNCIIWTLLVRVSIVSYMLILYMPEWDV